MISVLCSPSEHQWNIRLFYFDYTVRSVAALISTRFGNRTVTNNTNSAAIRAGQRQSPNGVNCVKSRNFTMSITPPFIGAVAWVLLAAPNSGLLNQYYRWITGAGPFDHLFNIFSSGGIIFVMASYAFPYVFVLVANTLDRMPHDLEEASAILGGGRWHTFRRVTLPMVLPALLAGFLIAFLQAMTQFGTPAILALPAGFHVLTTKIWSLFQFPPKTHLAAACAMPLLLVTVMLLQHELRRFCSAGAATRWSGGSPAHRN